ncbi:hypothetical protein OIU79_011964 [Salix purpurea]|uniref:Legume lectin domain-containing protein n=1 Tax=Salix purpurea TaxID=77065 RepID=A0A9Q0Q202_SALPP|nr:hypothetical protein OIU79_011964 [Salix purpurea]
MLMELAWKTGLEGPCTDCHSDCGEKKGRTQISIRPSCSMSKNMTASSGEGLAFILTADPAVPEGSDGQWLGIVNSRLNGTPEAQIVAVEFDTRKSFPEDLDDNHIGLDVNSVYSRRSVCVK